MGALLLPGGLKRFLQCHWQPVTGTTQRTSRTFAPSTMSASGSLTAYNNELVKTIEDLREQREELNRSILKDEEDKARIQKASGGRCDVPRGPVNRPGGPAITLPRPHSKKVV